MHLFKQRVQNPLCSMHMDEVDLEPLAYEGGPKIGKGSFFLNEKHLNVILYAGADYVFRQNTCCMYSLEKPQLTNMKDAVFTTISENCSSFSLLSGLEIS